MAETLAARQIKECEQDHVSAGVCPNYALGQHQRGTGAKLLGEQVQPDNANWILRSILYRGKRRWLKSIELIKLAPSLPHVGYLPFSAGGRRLSVFSGWIRRARSLQLVV